MPAVFFFFCILLRNAYIEHQNIIYLFCFAAPCQSDEFHCTLEDICIDDRLKCDGTRHCVDNLDESDCSCM